MSEQATPDQNLVSVTVARQPIFDGNRRLWGYELFGVGSAETTSSGFPEETNVAVSVASSAYMCLQQILDRGKKVIVHFNEKSILENLPYALPPVLASVKVEEHACERPSVLETLSRLKSDGYLIAVQGFTGDPACDSLYQLADMISIDVSDCSSDTLGDTLAKARPYRSQVMASRVQDPTQFKTCREMGFSLFHGAFFKSPENLTVRKLSSNEVLRFNLLQSIEKEDPDFTRLAETIQADVTVSFRLLTYLNSAAFAFTQRIKSIRQAITLLGWNNLKNWLRVVLLSDMNQSKEARELVLLSAQRGLLLELIARGHDFWGFYPGSLHLLGLFSLLDALLSMPMTEIVTYLPLDSRMKAALCRETDNEYLPLLQLAQYLEEARWAESEKLIQQLNLDGKKVKAALQASVNWANELAAVPAAKAPGR